jgi:cell division protein FtsB
MIKTLRKHLNTIIYIALIVLAIWISYIIVYGKGGIVKRRNLEIEIISLQREISELENSSGMIDIVIQNMRENERYIEGYARELGYRREGETIYKFIEREQ